MQWQWLVGPVMGGVIGYITNDIAVRMMFRPYTQKRIFGRRVPFTPGLIPKERPRLARAIRDVLDQDLLSPQVLEAALLSEDMLARIGEAADNAMQAILREERTPRMLLEGAFGPEDFASFETRTRRAVGLFLMEKILDSGIDRTMAGIVVKEARSRVTHSTAGIARLFWDDSRSASMEEKLTGEIREMLATYAPDQIEGMMDHALHEGLDTPISQLTGQYADRAGDLRGFLMEQYQRGIRAVLPAALGALDLGAIVEEKLNSLNMAELEGLIMQVMRKELRAIVWLGALLGTVLGLVNTFLPMLS